ncbi:Methyltransferase [Methanosarcina siciliae C2J]|uniref:Methyltransferase n=3 Tax=Methanosarcina siciliae TaxID=38027 RepID=A0A0E3LA44_9EURY|nr:class I SAM-dependent methyltransferase [Methanosarcina siciliae]AKB27434.1 Methyltransferase [Methanosarcina siciliae T4/M]AKB31376.1 Methyltransferase [Methanosarcina siciliae HI350]AKB35332.1 Methyltransferase [Methanosarcina siciliae C2J]
MTEYVHGYSEREALRLSEQAETLEKLLHHDTIYPPRAKVLEAGCGIGAQTVILAKNNPEAEITSIDISPESLEKARENVARNGFENVRFLQANIFSLPFEAESFDHIFVCFVLEHLQNPEEALKNLKKVLKPGGTLTVIEGDHGSCYFYPEGRNALDAWHCLIRVQAQMKGNSLIGRQLYPLMQMSGLREIRVEPRMVYADLSKPELVNGFVLKTIIPMVEGVKNQAMEMKMMEEEAWKKGIEELHQTAGPEGTFCYTFFKGRGTK